MDLRPDLLVFRELPSLQLGINQLAVDADLESAAVGRNQDQLLDSRLQFSNEFVGQTDRFRFVVSNLAVNNLDFHVDSLNP